VVELGKAHSLMLFLWMMSHCFIPKCIGFYLIGIASSIVAPISASHVDLVVVILSLFTLLSEPKIGKFMYPMISNSLTIP
jgi:hypothetical protein